jgi:hypothetical protein
VLRRISLCSADGQIHLSVDECDEYSACVAAPAVRGSSFSYYYLRALAVQRRNTVGSRQGTIRW